MLPIDDLAVVSALDRQGMLRCVDQLPDVLAAAFDRGRSCPLPAGTFRDVLVCGMGGSAISGELLRTLALMQAPWPVTVHRGDALPAWVSSDTLAIFLTYSGNTAETLGALREAISRGIPLVVVTSGGEAETLARSADIPTVKLPAGWQPRAALGDLYFSLLGLVSQLPGLAVPPVERVVHDLCEVRAHYTAAVPAEFNPAKKLATLLQGKTPLILGVQSSTESIAVRWKCQLNENAKMTAWSAVLPEFTHNEVVNLTAAPHPHVVLVHLQDASDSPLIRRQAAHTLDLLRPNLGGIFPAAAPAESLLSRQLQLIMLGDYVSVYAGLLAGVNPTPVEAITELKRRMAMESAAPTGVSS